MKLTYTDFEEMDLNALAALARKNSVTISVKVSFDTKELEIMPYEPYKPICPYSAREKEDENEADS